MIGDTDAIMVAEPLRLLCPGGEPALDERCTIALADLWHRVHHASFPYLTGSFSKASFRDHVANRLLVEQRVWIAGPLTSPIGFAALRGDLLTQLHVTPERQGVGIGSRLLRAVIDDAPFSLRVSVFAPNLRALRFYARHGFEVLTISNDPILGTDVVSLVRERRSCRSGTS